MPNSSAHTAVTDACFAGGASAAALAQAFGRAFAAVWVRANATLGDVTLGAVAQRVVDVASERFPGFPKIVATSAAAVSDAVNARASAAGADELRALVRFLLAEFLTVLGRLTGEILTPTLHAEVAAATTARAPGPPSTAPGEEPQS